MENAKFYIYLSLHIASLFIAAMIFNFIGEVMYKYLGDYICTGNAATCEGNHENGYKAIAGIIHWGWRHWLYLLMGISLFAVSIIRIFEWIGKNFKD